MNLEDQVCSLELAKKLKELGVKQESYFYHCINKLNNNYEILDYDNKYYIYSENNEDILCDYFEYYSAYTVAELGKMLPKYIEIENKHINNDYDEKFNKYYLGYDENGYPSYDYYDFTECPSYKRNETEANARAKMLIDLIENGLVKI